ncbi:hypothetical protein FOZ63_019802, partial [Perkinsus olseni]
SSNQMAEQAKIYFATLYFNPRDERQKILRGSTCSNDVASLQKNMWQKVTGDINERFGLSYTVKQVKAMRDAMTKVVGRASAVYRQRLASLPTGGGDPIPTFDPEGCNEPWFLAISGFVFESPRFGGIASGLEAGVEPTDDLGPTLSYKQMCHYRDPLRSSKMARRALSPMYS